MNESTENLILEYMRRFNSRLDRVDEDMQDIRLRLGSVEGQLANQSKGIALMRDSIAVVHQDVARLSNRMDRVDDRLRRVEAALEIAPA